MNTDPYRTIASGAVTAADIEQYKRQAIPTSAEMLEVVRNHRLILIFDLKELAAPSASGQSFFDIVFRQIHEAGIDSQVGFLVNRDDLQVVRTAAPAMRPVAGIDFRKPTQAADLTGYQIVNAEYGLPKDWIKKCQAAGMWVNLYTIDKPWQYSRLWLLGVQSTTSSNAHTLLALDRPLLALPYSQYLLIWIAVGLLCFALLFGFTLRGLQGGAREPRLAA